MADDLETVLKASPLSQAQRADLWDAYHNAPDADALASALESLSVPKQVKAKLWDLKSTTATPAPATPNAVPPTATAPTPPSASDAFLSAATMGLPADVVRGVAKGAARTALGAGELVGKIPGVRTAVDTLYGQPGLSERAFQQAHDATSAANTGEMVGKGLETAAELAVPVGKAAELLPSTARAGEKFQQVMGAAKNIPIDVNAPGQVALRIQELSEHGGSLPMVARKFINYVTDPNKPPMTYEVARDFASNVSRLSSQEFQRLTPVVAREVANLRVTLNKAVADAASKAGKGKEYAEAMTEYARAMKVSKAIDSVIAGAKRAAPYGLGAGVAGAAGYGLGRKIIDMWSGE